MRTQPFPGTISAVVAQQHKRRGHGRRVNVFIDGRFSFSVDATVAMDRKLRPGLEINETRLQILLREDGDARALASALQYLTYRMRTRSEMEKRLQRDEWPDVVIGRALDKLEANGLLNDENFAALWVDSRSRTKPRSSRVLQQELRLKGVPKEAIEATLPGADTELQNAVAAVQRKWESWAGLPEKDRRDKALAFLQRRGFSYSIAKEALQLLSDDNI